MKRTIKETHVQNFPTGDFSKKGKKMKVATLTFALQQNINKREKQIYGCPSLKHVP
jgi:hypothetical protein